MKNPTIEKYYVLHADEWEHEVTWKVGKRCWRIERFTYHRKLDDKHVIAIAKILDAAYKQQENPMSEKR